MPVTRSHVTRALHLAILLIIAHQLLGSLIMEPPLPGEDAEWPFKMHQGAGLAGLGALTLFWIWTLVRDRSETSLASLFPWFDAASLRALFADVASPLRRIASGRWPSFELPALASAVHGLGLALASFLALTGSAWYFLAQGTAYGKPLLGLHSLAGNLMWAYVIGHAAMGVAHQLGGDNVFSRMFWVRDGRAGLPLAPAE